MAADLSDLEADLTGNSLAFLRRAIAGVTSAGRDTQDLTFAVVDLAVAVEVLLKARLVREHWSLILADLDRADRASLLSGSAKTVTPDQAIRRLEGITFVSLAAKDKRGADRSAQVKSLVDLRNRAAHFTLAGQDSVGIRAQLGAGLHFVLWFLNAQFRDSDGEGDPTVRSLVDELISDVAGEIGKIEELVKIRLAELDATLNASEVCVECPRCGQPTLMLGADDGIANCPFCLSLEPVGESIAEEYVEQCLHLSAYEVVKDGGEWPIHHCVECGARALVEGVLQLRPSAAALNPPSTSPCDWLDTTHWACFACGFVATAAGLERCHRCGILSYQSLCPDCSADLFAGD